MRISIKLITNITFMLNIIKGSIFDDKLYIHMDISTLSDKLVSYIIEPTIGILCIPFEDIIVINFKSNYLV